MALFGSADHVINWTDSKVSEALSHCATLAWNVLLLNQKKLIKYWGKPLENIAHSASVDYIAISFDAKIRLFWLPKLFCFSVQPPPTNYHINQNLGLITGNYSSLHPFIICLHLFIFSGPCLKKMTPFCTNWVCPSICHNIHVEHYNPCFCTNLHHTFFHKLRASY